MYKRYLTGRRSNVEACFSWKTQLCEPRCVLHAIYITSRPLARSALTMLSTTNKTAQSQVSSPTRLDEILRALATDDSEYEWFAATMIWHWRHQATSGHVMYINMAAAQRKSVTMHSVFVERFQSFFQFLHNTLLQLFNSSSCSGCYLCIHCSLLYTLIHVHSKCIVATINYL